MTPAPIAIDSTNHQPTDYQEEEIQQPTPVAAVSRHTHRKQTAKPVAPAIVQAEVDTSSQAPANVVVKKVKRQKRQTIVIENNHKNINTNE
jgi:hypothetical protein